MASGVFKDLSGLTFERLKVLSRLPNKNGKVMWKCLCSCGKITSVRGDSFNQNKPNTRSCCCLQKEVASRYKGKLRIPAGQKIINDLYYNYKRRSISKSLVWDISKEEFTSFIFNKCFYCGTDSGNLAVNPRIKSDILKYNGIDRINSKLGYIKNNCVSCCGQCNYAKLDYSTDEFFNWISKIYLNLKEKNII